MVATNILTAWIIEGDADRAINDSFAGEESYPKTHYNLPFFNNLNQIYFTRQCNPNKK